MKIDDCLVNKEKDIPLIKKFADITNFNDKLKYLAAIAEDENWDYKDGKDVHPILFQYIIHTFNRIYLEKKLSFYDSDQIALFNTGLLTKNGEDIYACFKRTTTSPDGHLWYLDSFYKESDRDIISCRPLPLVADYYKSIDGDSVESFLMLVAILC